jgi:hypothetical protein
LQKLPIPEAKSKFLVLWVKRPEKTRHEGKLKVTVESRMRSVNEGRRRNAAGRPRFFFDSSKTLASNPWKKQSDKIDAIENF